MKQTRQLVDYPPAMLEKYAAKWVTKQTPVRSPRIFKALRPDLSLAEYVRRFERASLLVSSVIPEAWESIVFVKEERRTERAKTRDLVDLPPKLLAKEASRFVTKQSSASPERNFPLAPTRSRSTSAASRSSTTW